MSAQAIKTIPSSTASGTNNLASDLKPQGETATKFKPCCVCKDEKAARDECMLFSNSSDPQEACQSLVGQYRSCMKGYGFNLP